MHFRSSRIRPNLVIGRQWTIGPTRFESRPLSPHDIRGGNGSASHLFSGCQFAEGVLNSASKTEQCVTIFITE